MAKIKKKKVGKPVKTKDSHPKKDTSEKKTQKEPVKESKKIETKEVFEFKSIDMNIIKKAIPILLILIVMWFAFFIRSGPINLNGLDERVEANTYAQIKGMIEQQVRAERSGLSEQYVQEIVEKRYQEVVDSGTIEIQGQVVDISVIAAQNTAGIKQAFKAENGQTYLNAIDPYHFLKLATNYVENGHQGEELREDETGEVRPYVSYKLAPKGNFLSKKEEFHVWLMGTLMKLKGVDENSSIGERTAAVFLIPVIFAMLSAIPAFLIIRRFSDDIFAFFGSLVLVSIGTFVSRTIAGFVDTDAYNVFFPLLIAAFFIYGFAYNSKIKTIIFAGLAGLSQGLFMWAWGNGWFMFVFSILSLIGYIGYTIIQELINKAKIKEIVDKSMNSLITLVTFTISSFIFTLIFWGQNIFNLAYNGILLGTSEEGLKGATVGNIWPNVLSSVAELNAASFPQIVSSVGGKIVFLIAMFGILYLILEDSMKGKYKKYSIALSIFAFIWSLLIIVGNNFVSLTANSPLMFLLVLFFPVGIAFIISLVDGDNSNRIFLSMLLSVWMAGTIFMSLFGVRFILLLGPAFAIAFGIGLYYLSSLLNGFLSKEMHLKKDWAKKTPGLIITGILFLALFSPLYTQANAISKGTYPNFDDQWYATMNKIKTETDENAIITSWWDFGHFFATASDRGVTFDGGSQTVPASHWVGKLLMENDENVSHDILRMLACGNNQAYDTMFEYVGKDSSDGVKINKIIYSTLGKDLNQTRTILSNNKYYEFSETQVDTIMSYLACEEPAQNILITSQDMVGKAGVWAHWGSWDFTKKYVLDNYKTMSANEIANAIDEDVGLIEDYLTQIQTIDVTVQSENANRESLVNQWLAPYPGYAGTYNCLSENSTFICENGVTIDFITGKIEVMEQARAQGFTAEYSKLIFVNALGELQVIEQNNSGVLEILILPGTSKDSATILAAQTPLGDSLFTKLFYLDGLGTKYFDKFDDISSATGVRVKSWNVLWEEPAVDVGNISGLNIDTIEYNATLDEVEELIGEDLNMSLNETVFNNSQNNS